LPNGLILHQETPQCKWSEARWRTSSLTPFRRFRAARPSDSPIPGSQTHPAADVIVRVADELNVSVEYLVNGGQNPLALASSISDRPALRSLIERLVPLGDDDIIKATKILNAATFDSSNE
jgi:hypothetical protein